MTNTPKADARGATRGRAAGSGKRNRAESAGQFSHAKASGKDNAPARTPDRQSSLEELVRRELRKAAVNARTSVSILDELRAHGFSREEVSDLVVPRRTLVRRRESDGLLSDEESGRAVRLARMAALANRVFGDDAKAHRWLRKASPMLDGAIPLDLLKTETGAQLVEQTLHGIDYGMFA